MKLSRLLKFFRNLRVQERNEHVPLVPYYYDILEREVGRELVLCVGVGGLNMCVCVCVCVYVLRCLH